MNPKKKGRQFEVHEENHDSKVNESMRDRDPIGLFVDDEDDCCSDTSFGCTEKRTRRLETIISLIIKRDM